MCIEITITMKDEEGSRNYKKKFLEYEPLLLNGPAGVIPDIYKYVEETVKEFGSPADSCKVRINLEMGPVPYSSQSAIDSA